MKINYLTFLYEPSGHRGVIITSLSRQNDVAKSFDVIMTLLLHRVFVGKWCDVSTCQVQILVTWTRSAVDRSKRHIVSHFVPKQDNFLLSIVKWDESDEVPIISLKYVIWCVRNKTMFENINRDDCCKNAKLHNEKVVSWGRPAPRCARSNGRPHSGVVARLTTAPDAKPWSIPTLTHWGRVTHISVIKLTIIGSDNGLLPGRHQALIWTNAGILVIGPLGINLSEILIEIHIS